MCGCGREIARRKPVDGTRFKILNQRQMSRSIPISKHNKSLNKKDIIEKLVNRTKLSRQAVSLIISEYGELIKEELIAGNAVQFPNVCTFTLRRRDYSEERRKNFHMTEKATLPEFCYYPYALMSVPLRQDIAKEKYNIAERLTVND